MRSLRFRFVPFVAAIAFISACGSPQPAREVAPAPLPSKAPAPKAPEPSAKPASPAATPRRPRAPEAPKPESPPPAPIVEASPSTGTLHIDADVPGAQVFIDREFIGAAPVTANSVKLGQHRLNVSVDGYEGVAQTIDVEPGPRDIKIRFKEVRLDARIDVIHKHRMGQCKGTLIATPQGIRYETTDKDDAFRAGLLDLETFEIEYIDKNLKVKPKKGKQYSFTDPEGNADRLFVFHRDVEKARDRLKKGDAPASN